MQLRNLCAADGQPAAAGGVDQLPGLPPGGFLKVEPPVRLLIGWRRLAQLGDLVHLGGDGSGIARPSLQTVACVKMKSSGAPQCR